MSAWAQRARAHFSKTRPPPTDKTDETPLLSVLSVPPAGVFEKSQGGFGTFVGFVSTPRAHSGKTSPPAPAPGPQGLDPGHDALLAMAMKFCDATHASDKEREDWQRDVLETPPELRQGLYNYLREQMHPVNLLWRNQK